MSSSISLPVSVRTLVHVYPLAPYVRLHAGGVWEDEAGGSVLDLHLCGRGVGLGGFEELLRGDTGLVVFGLFERSRIECKRVLLER